MTPTPRSRLEQLLENLHLPATGNDATRDKAKMEADVRSAIEIIEAMGKLTESVNNA